jgi:hypothetical protein
MAEEEQKTGGEKAQEVKQAWEEAEEKVKGLEEDPPKDLEDWPDDEAKYVTFGGGEGDHGYDEGPESKLGPSSVRRYEDGSVEVEGEKVDNPDDYKMEPIGMSTETATAKREKREGGGDDDSDDDGDDSSSS